MGKTNNEKKYQLSYSNSQIELLKKSLDNKKQQPVSVIGSSIVHQYPVNPSTPSNKSQVGNNIPDTNQNEPSL